MRLLRALLVLGLALPAAASGPNRGVVPPSVPRLEAPLAPPSFPVKTAPEFFAGARHIVDLGGETIGPWTVELAKANPDAAVHTVNIDYVERDIGFLRQLFKAPNLHQHEYDFFDRPEAHPKGDRVVMNSPHFGGLTVRDPDEIAAVAEAHLTPGGLFYAQGDDLWFLNMVEMRWLAGQDVQAIVGGRTVPAPSLREVVEGRKNLVVEAFQRRFGRDNVSLRPISGYDPYQKLNAADLHSIQVRKPL